MITKLNLLVVVAVFTLATPALGQSLPTNVLGSWDVSVEECRRSGTSMTQIDITPRKINTYGGDATVVEVERSGPVTFVAADYLQLEGAAEVGERERTYFQLTQGSGPDRLNFRWKDIQTVDLVRCSHDATERPTDESSAQDDSVLPLPTGLWVIAGDDCQNPANASWRVYDGRGIYGAASRSCEIDAVSTEGNRHIVEQICIATYDGSETTHQDIVIKQAPRRFGLLEDGETNMQDFNWCGPRLRP